LDRPRHRLWVEAHGADDVDLFADVEKWRGRTYIPFEGSYGFGRDRITTGWLKASLRALDQQRSRPFDPVPTCSRRQPLAPGQVVLVDIALGPSATLFEAGETLRLVVAGRWLWPGEDTLRGADFGSPDDPSRRNQHPHGGALLEVAGLVHRHRPRIADVLDDGLIRVDRAAAALIFHAKIAVSR
jgi:predicted acyl esterase